MCVYVCVCGENYVVGDWNSCGDMFLWGGAEQIQRFLHLYRSTVLL